jgi:hypothetical protein
MTIPAGIHTFGPANATLAVKTGRTGAAAKAGHNLVTHVMAWEGTLELGPDPPRPTSRSMRTGHRCGCRMARAACSRSARTTRRASRSRSTTTSSGARTSGSWGIKPYSTLFGALKVVDEVDVVIDALLPAG